MKNKQKGFTKAGSGCAIIFLFLRLTTVYAQQTVSSSGGDAFSNIGSISFSVGQLLILDQTGSNGSVMNGVQQPYEISVITAIEENEMSQYIFAYPNPVTGLLNLDVFRYAGGNLSFQLFNIHGKILIDKSITSTETSIGMNDFVPGIYLLKVKQENKEIKAFKIIKN